MASIFELLPGQAQKDELLANFNAAMTPEALGLNVFQQLDVRTLADSFPIQEIQSLQIGSLPSLPASLSKEEFLQQWQDSLAQIKGMNFATLRAEIERSSPPLLPQPNFRFSEMAGQITAAIVPAVKVELPVAVVGASMAELLDLPQLQSELTQLAQTGAAMPLRFLNVLFGMLDKLVSSLTDADKLVQFTEQSLQDIYGQQLEKLDTLLPLVALEQTLLLTSVSEEPDSFSAQYALLLDQIDVLADGDIVRARKLTQRAEQVVIPALRTLEQAGVTLNMLGTDNSTALRTALTSVVDLNTTNTALVQPYVTSIGARIGQVLDAIAGPVGQIRSMSNQIQAYLNQTIRFARDGAQYMSERIEFALRQIETWIQTIEARIQGIQKQIETFIADLDITPFLLRAKAGCARIGEGVDRFFTQIETLKLQLDGSVATLGEQIDEQVTQAFLELETKIRELLAQILALLNREDVQQLLQQVREGIEKFKEIIDQASFQPVFDLVLTKTGELENNIKAIDVASMSVPQRTALKVGATVLREVRVDEIVKPEILEAFEEIRAPLAEMIKLIGDKVRQIEREIELFNPGSLLTDLLVDSGPYKLLMQVLESFRPSLLLTPLQDLNVKVTEIVQILDPNLIVREVQKLYESVAGLLEIFDPAPFTQLIDDALGTATTELADIRDNQMEQIVQLVRETISMQRLLGGTGLSEISNPEFWQILVNIVGGGYLNRMVETIEEVERQLTERAGEAVDSKAMQQRLQRIQANARRQQAATAPLIKAQAQELHTALQSDYFTNLQQRRIDLRSRHAANREVIQLLDDIDLAPLLQLQPAARTLAGLTTTKLKKAVTNVNTLLNEQDAALQSLDAAFLQSVVTSVFRVQIGVPVREEISLLQQKLAPFQETVVAIQSILETVLGLPSEIDANVSNVLAALQTNVSAVITQIIAAIEVAGETLTKTPELVYAQIQHNLERLSPAWMLNAFAESDFAHDASAARTQPAGMLRMAERIVNSANPGGSDLFALMRSQLIENEFLVLQAGVERWQENPNNGLPPGACTNVLKAMNQMLGDSSLFSSDYLDTTQDALESQIKTIETTLDTLLQDNEATADQKIRQIKQLHRLNTLQTQLKSVAPRYRSTQQRADLIRLNRILLEVSYPEDIVMGLQSLHPYIVEQVAHLYPAVTVRRLDDIYGGVVDKIAQLPDQLIRSPLDEAFGEVKQLLKQNFDIASIFEPLDLKLDSVDEDLALGLDKLSDAYSRLLNTFDQRLSAA